MTIIITVGRVFNVGPVGFTSGVTRVLGARGKSNEVYPLPWASANGVSRPPPGKMDKKLKSENMQKEQFPMFMLYSESNQDRHV